jgi:hypothetical protein
MSGAIELLESLELTLRAEQRAVAALDLEQLERLTQEKQRLAAALAAARDAGGELPRASLGRIAALADANAALLDSAVGTMREALGVDRPLGTYDARARLRNGSASLAVRVL